MIAIVNPPLFSQSYYFVFIFLIHRHGHSQNHRASIGRDGAPIRSRHIELQSWRRAITNYILVQRRRITQSGTRLASHDLTIRRTILLEGKFLLVALTYSSVYVSFMFIVWHEICHMLRCHPSDWVFMPLNGSYLREHLTTYVFMRFLRFICQCHLAATASTLCLSSSTFAVNKQTEVRVNIEQAAKTYAKHCIHFNLVEFILLQ